MKRGEEMRIKDILAKNQSGVSLEFFPFYRGGTEEEILQREQKFIAIIKKLEKLNPLFVSITCGAGGTGSHERTFRTIKVIQKNSNFVPMAHFTCVGLNRDGAGEALEYYKNTGVRNILALRGDPPKGEKEFKPPENGFKCARELVEFIRKEFGDYFSIGVAVYPEGHPEELRITKEREYTEQKIEAGADFAITQLFLDNNYYYNFLKWADKRGIDIPIIPGILTDYGSIYKFCRITGTSIPHPLLQQIEVMEEKAKEDILQFSIEEAVKQCKDMLKTKKAVVPFLHLYTLNKSKAVIKIYESLKNLLK